MDETYTLEEIYNEIKVLKRIFYAVRIVNPIENMVYEISNDLEKIYMQQSECYSIWNKDKKCENCISKKAFLNKSSYEKFEFIDDEIYYVISRYIEVGNEKYVMEIVCKIDNGIILNAEGSGQFIDRIVRLNKKIYKDELTGIYNRRYMNEELEKSICTILDSNRDLGIAIVDIDDFKEVNDRFGHLQGDKVICKIANILIKSINEKNGDYAVRYGGDEFILVLNNTNEGEFEKTLKKILRKISNIKVRGMDTYNISISIGGARVKEISTRNIEEIINLADKRLYTSKTLGKNMVCTKE